jgi:transcriptional regulator with XRE-family HTH domain
MMKPPPDGGLKGGRRGVVATEGKSRLAEWRGAAGLTLQEVADLTGTTPAMLSRAERGERSFLPATKVKIARRLGVRVADLFEVEDLVEAGIG